MTEDLAKLSQSSGHNRVTKTESASQGCPLHESIAGLDKRVREGANSKYSLSLYYEKALKKMLATKAMPSHPQSAFCIYSQRRREEILAEVPGLPQKKIMKQVIREWKHMDQTDFKDEAREIYEQFRLMNRWWKEEFVHLQFSQEELEEEIKFWEKEPQIQSERLSLDLSLGAHPMDRLDGSPPLGSLDGKEKNPILPRHQRTKPSKKEKSLPARLKKQPSLPGLEQQYNIQDIPDKSVSTASKSTGQAPDLHRPIFKVHKKSGPGHSKASASLRDLSLPVLPPCNYVIRLAGWNISALEGSTEDEKAAFSSVIFPKP